MCFHRWESLKTTLTHYTRYQNACYNNMDQYTSHKITIAKGRVNNENLATCIFQGIYSYMKCVTKDHM